MEVSTVDPDLGDNGTDFFTLSETFGGLFDITTLPNNRVSLLGLYCSKLHTLC
jgi:ABC-type oligopeptide transport system substrate-binding subunit